MSCQTSSYFKAYCIEMALVDPANHNIPMDDSNLFPSRVSCRNENIYSQFLLNYNTHLNYTESPAESFQVEPSHHTGFLSVVS